MIVQPDIVIIQTLIDGFAGLRLDPTPIQDIFASHTQDEISDIQNYFSNTATPIRHGWAKTANEIGTGAVFVSIANSQETESRQFLGSNAPDETPGVNTNDEYLGSFFNTTLRISCKAPNANKALYISTIAKWILIGNRVSLENENGLAQQVLSINDLIPQKVYEPDFVFTRDIMYQCLHLDIVDITVATATVKSITVAPNATVDSTQVFSIT